MLYLHVEQALNVQDLTTLITLTPPMLGGARALALIDPVGKPEKRMQTVVTRDTHQPLAVPANPLAHDDAVAQPARGSRPVRPRRMFLR